MKSYKIIIVAGFCLIVIKMFIIDSNKDEKEIVEKTEKEHKLSKILNQFMEKKAVVDALKDTATLLPEEIGTYDFESGGKKISEVMTIGQYETLMTKELITNGEQKALHQINKNIIEKSANGVEMFRNSIRDMLKMYKNSAEKVAFLNRTYEKLFDEETIKLFREKAIALKAAEKKVTVSGKPEPKPKIE